jgi:hypothetical protein
MMRKFLLIWAVFLCLVGGANAQQPWTVGKTGFTSQQGVESSYQFLWITSLTASPILDVRHCTGGKSWRFDPSITTDDTGATMDLLQCSSGSGGCTTTLASVTASTLVEDNTEGKSAVYDFRKLPDTLEYLQIKPNAAAPAVFGNARGAVAEVLCKQTPIERPAVSVASFQNMRYLINNFFAYTDYTARFSCTDAFDSPACPAVPQTTGSADGFCDANCQPRSAGSLTTRSIGGAHGNQVVNFSRRTAAPFVAVPSVAFTGSSVNAEGYQWVQNEGHGIDFNYGDAAALFASSSPLIVEYFVNMGFGNSPVGTATFLGTFSNAVDVLQVDGTLPPVTTGQSMGFHVRPDGNLYLTYSDTESIILDYNLGIAIAADKEYRLRWEFEIAERDSAFQVQSYRSSLRAYLDDKLIYDGVGQNADDFLNIVLTPNMMPGVAQVRTSATRPVIITQWGYGFRYGGSAFITP